MPLTLHQQCTNLVITSEPQYKLNTDLAKIQELNTNDLSFTLDGVLSTLQQGSAENGVGSSVELRYHVEKAPCLIETNVSGCSAPRVR